MISPRGRAQMVTPKVSITKLLYFYALTANTNPVSAGLKNLHVRTFSEQKNEGRNS